MDPKGMEPYVDWFGFMSYDLHGPWDAGVKTIGSLVQPQTNIREIINNTLPLWFDKLTPAKINLGLAYYGRGFTLSDKFCTSMGCVFKGPSKAANCTNFDGVMSNREIKQLIKDKRLTPKLIEEAQVKQITWDDQWIGYDDDETINAKVQAANSLCMGGTMIWSIDFDSGSGSGDVPDGIIAADGNNTSSGDSSSGGGNNLGSGSGGNSGGGHSGASGSGLVYVNETMWTDQNPLVACEPPCVLVLPPTQLPSPTVISFPPWTTTYVINTVTSNTKGQGGIPTLLTISTTIKIPPITTTEIQMWPVTVFSNDSSTATFTPVQSIQPPPITTYLPGPPPALHDPGDSTYTLMKSHQTTLYPQPTQNIDLPPKHPVTYTRGPPKATCAAHCGHHDCRIFGCGGGCSLFGCGDNCGLLGCGGGCGIAGCGGPCSIFGCGGCGLAGCGVTACPLCGPNLDINGGGDTIGGDDPDNDTNNDDQDGDENDNEDDDEDDEEDVETEICLLEEADLPGDIIPGDSFMPGDLVTSIEGLSTDFFATVSLSLKPTKGITSTSSRDSVTTVYSTTVTSTFTPTLSPTRCYVTFVMKANDFDNLYTIQVTGINGAWAANQGSKLHDAMADCGYIQKYQWIEDLNDGKGGSAIIDLVDRGKAAVAVTTRGFEVLPDVAERVIVRRASFYQRFSFQNFWFNGNILVPGHSTVSIAVRIKHD
ncbi:MAG: hypothetical protein Q9222_002552 [Ikaeria aurantiellina]